ncbi:hypothetical protein TNCT_613931 [Trichonephila clavata]|uniref:Uncharacterized protein n=1 Tax=Trichonephila clavata TaxID=2740835 RepID=A0A8X6LB06_TRICU|nr:hypothetical protein TNCT_613931 [Trichonephila clavata]
MNVNDDPTEIEFFGGEKEYILQYTRDHIRHRTQMSPNGNVMAFTPLEAYFDVCLVKKSKVSSLEIKMYILCSEKIDSTKITDAIDGKEIIETRLRESLTIPNFYLL